MSTNPRINSPLIWINLTLHAFSNAVTEYNKGKKNGEKLKEEHYTLFKVLINSYNTSITNIRTNFENSPYSPVHNKKINELPFLELNTTNVGKYLKREQKTIKARLNRLEKAGILKITFHSRKRPLSVQFSDKILKIIDLKNPEIERINPKFVTNWDLTSPIEIRKNLQDIKDSTRTYLKLKNNRGGAVFSAKKPNTNFSSNSKLNSTEETTFLQKKQHYKKASPQEQKENMEKIKDFYSFSATQANYRNSGEAVEKNGHKQTFFQKNERFGEKNKQSSGDFDYILNLVENLNKNQSNADIFKAKNLLPVGDRILIARYNNANQFYNYLVNKMFADKKELLSENYKKRTVAYIFDHYFASSKGGLTLSTMEKWWRQYKYRIDTAADYMRSMTDFDTSFHYPLSYLNIEKREKNSWSFVNTAKFWQNRVEWAAKNNLKKEIDTQNRYKALPEGIQKKYYAICRQFENKRISFDKAQMKLKALSQTSDEALKLFMARYSASYAV